MRLWHPDLIARIDNKRLLGLHREVHGLYTIAVEARPAYRNHPLVKEFLNDPNWLFQYHSVVVKEMENRGYNHNSPLFVRTIDGRLIDPKNVKTTPAVYEYCLELYPPPGNPYLRIGTFWAKGGKISVDTFYEANDVNNPYSPEAAYQLWYERDSKVLHKKGAWMR